MLSEIDLIRLALGAVLLGSVVLFARGRRKLALAVAIGAMIVAAVV